MNTHQIITGDCIEGMKTLPDACVHTCITSPPYFALRDYNGGENEIGQEDTVNGYVEKLVDVFREIRRILRNDGTVWLNLGDSYMSAKNCAPPPQSIGGQRGMPSDFVPANRRDQEGLKGKDLIGIPWRVAFALQADGWYLRQDIIWHKPNPMPESVEDRCTKAHEYIFMLSKKSHYYYDHEAIKEDAVGKPHTPGNKNVTQPKEKGARDPALDPDRVWAADGKKNKRSVWTVNTKGYKGAHFAVYPEDLILPCVLAGSSAHGCCSKCGTPWKRQTAKPTQNLKPVEPIERKGVTLTPEDSATVLWLENNGADYRISVEGDKHTEQWNDIPISNGRRSQFKKKGYTLLTWGEGTVESGWVQQCKCKDAKVVPCTVFDPFTGSGTTAVVALKNKRNFIGTELNPDYVKIAEDRIAEAVPQTLESLMGVEEQTAVEEPPPLVSDSKN